MTNFVKIQKGAFECLVLPHNIDKVEAALAKVKPLVMSYGKRSRYDNARAFPNYQPGISTGEYVSLYNSANHHLSLTDTIDANRYAHPAAQYDPNVPLCVEDANPDYIAGTDDAPVKGKRVSKQAARIANLEVALDICIAQMMQAQKLVDCAEFNNAIYAAQKALDKVTT